ncbi:3192_t:CDS:2, partial [Cetraspora pellucida]
PYSLIPIILESQYATLADTMYLWTRLQGIVNLIDDDDFRHYIVAQIQYRWNRMYNSLFVICWSLHPKYFRMKVIRPELTTIVKREASLLFKCLFPNKNITRFRMQLIDWTNKTNLFDFDGNRDNYLVENPNEKETDSFEQSVQVNRMNFDEENISNFEFDDVDNDDVLEQSDEENIMQTIENIDNFNVNDQITFSDAMIKSSIQNTHTNHR